MCLRDTVSDNLSDLYLKYYLLSNIDNKVFPTLRNAPDKIFLRQHSYKRRPFNVHKKHIPIVKINIFKIWSGYNEP